MHATMTLALRFGGEMKSAAQFRTPHIDPKQSSEAKRGQSQVLKNGRTPKGRDGDIVFGLRCESDICMRIIKAVDGDDS